MKKTKGIISAGHQLTAKAGKRMLEEGGNAYDAALAALMASFVTESGSISAGGGGFMLAMNAKGKSCLYDFFTQTPKYKRPLGELDFYPIEVEFPDANQVFHIGKGSMATPGNLAAVFHIHQRLGSLPIRVIAEPAIEIAKKGCMMDAFQEQVTTLLEPIIKSNADWSGIYLDEQGNLKKQGSHIFMEHLGETLDYLTNAGSAAEFYQGEIARQLVKDCSEGGGYLTMEDLQSYEVIERRPLSFNYRGRQILTNGLPCSGGILIAFSLQLLEKYDLSSIPFGSECYVQCITQAMKMTNLARAAKLDDGLYNTELLQEFLSENNLGHYQEAMDRHFNKLGCTTHISVLDAEGNAASITTSSGECAGYIIPGTGIMMNNMLGEADLNPQGFHEWESGQRMSSMMSPTIVASPERGIEAVLGSGGSNRIRTALFQSLIHLIDYGLPIQSAVERPRLHLEAGELNLEGGFAQERLQQMDLGSDMTTNFWSEQHMFFGGVNAVAQDAQGNLSGIGDERRHGVVMEVS